MAKDFYEVSNNPVSLFVVSADSKISGTIESKQDIRIDGTVEGKIKCSGKIVIGEKAKVSGEVEASDIDVYGRLDAQIIVHNNFVLKSTAVFSGDAKMKNIISELGAQLNLKTNLSTTDNSDVESDNSAEDESLY